MTKKKGFSVVEQDWNEALHPPHIQVDIKKFVSRPKYMAFSTTTGYRVASGNTLEDLNFSLNRFFSID